MAEKVTVMVLKVDLECPCCYKKVKKILCKFPQIRDQIYNEKANKVTITVVCWNPEKFRDKLCCKGAKVIKSIEIVDPNSKQNGKTKDEKHKEKKPQEETKKPPSPSQSPPPSESIKGPGSCGYIPVFPVRTCCRACSEGYGGGPCYFGYGVPPPPRPCYGGYYGYGHHERPCHITRCDYYFSEENPQVCSIM